MYRECTDEPYSFLVIHSLLASNNPLRFRKIFLTYIIKVMTINDQIRDEKIQNDINREAAKISALSSGKICKYQYHTGEVILPSNQQQIIEQENFTYSPLRKLLKNK